MTDIQATDAITRLTRDLKAAARTLSDAEARYLVDYYYQLQEDRIRSGNQVQQMSETAEPSEVLVWLATNTGVLERQIARALDAYTGARVVGVWARSIVGIGPILSAGLLAHIDITKAPTVGHIWRFAGLDPTVTWEKKQRRPWNARLKTLCWKMGESFVKVSGHPDDVYGKLYLHRKALEISRNEAGAFADQAAAALVAKKYGADTTARKEYEAGRLPAARIHMRAKRWAVKLYLAHFHAVAFRDRFGTDPPKPYVLAHLGHVDEIQVPNWPWS
jgi:Transposase IS116/IS110/IS902 family